MTSTTTTREGGNGDARGEFSRRAIGLFHDGYQVVPIPKGGKGPTLKDWSKLADTQTEEQVREMARTANGDGVGILAKRTAGVDIDVCDFELVQRLIGIAHKELGHTVERYGEAPKALLPYRVEIPFRKVTSREFRLPGDKLGDKRHKVEILADGQQFVAYHTHPVTGRPYHWPEGDLPPRDELPEIDEAKARRFVELAEAAIFAAGGVAVANGQSRGAEEGRTSPHGQTGSYEAVAAALDAIPHLADDYGQWIEVGHAIKGALGEEGRDLWHAWSSRSPKYDAAQADKKWTGFKPDKIGAGTIYDLAQKAGWKPPRGMALNPEKAKRKATPEPETTEPESAVLKELLDEYFVVLHAGKVMIAYEEQDAALKRRALKFLELSGLRLLYANQFIVTNDGRVPVAKAWMASSKRRTYTRLALLPEQEAPPDTYNLWRGFGAEPKAGECPLILAYLKEVICSDNKAHFDWLLNWMSYCIQYPERQAESAVVLRGLKGTGKGTFGRLMMRIFRHHALQITQQKHLVGNFNAHLLDSLLLFVDEAFWAGDKQGLGALNALITEPTVMIEPKNLTPFMAPNRLKIVMAANADWVVPATADERRYFVPTVSEHRMGDIPYFNKLNAAIDGDELPALLHYLKRRDLSGFDIRNPPHTKELGRQKLIGADSVGRFWFDCLTAGGIVGTGEVHWPEFVVTQVLYAAYVDHAQQHGDRHPRSINYMAEGLLKLWEHSGARFARSSEPWTNQNTGKEVKRPTGYMLDTLEKHREAFLAAMKIDPADHAWPKVEGEA